MKSLKSLLTLVLIVLFANGCKQKTSAEYISQVNNPDFYHDCVNQLTDVIVHDIFTPPVASRIYSYATLAGYEALVSGEKDMPSMVGRVKISTKCQKSKWVKNIVINWRVLKHS